MISWVFSLQVEFQPFLVLSLIDELKWTWNMPAALALICHQWGAITDKRQPECSQDHVFSAKNMIDIFYYQLKNSTS